MEYNIKLCLVTKDQIGEEQDNFRASMETKDNYFIGWGLTIAESLQDLEEEIKRNKL